MVPSLPFQQSCFLELMIASRKGRLVPLLHALLPITTGDSETYSDHRFKQGREAACFCFCRRRGDVCELQGRDEGGGKKKKKGRDKRCHQSEAIRATGSSIVRPWGFHGRLAWEILLSDKSNRIQTVVERRRLEPQMAATIESVCRDTLGNRTRERGNGRKQRTLH